MSEPKRAYSYVRDIIRDDPEDMPPLTHRLIMEARRMHDERPNPGSGRTHYPGRNPLEYMARAHDLSSHIGGSTYGWRDVSLEIPTTMWGYGAFLKRCSQVADSIHTTISYSGLNWWARMDARHREGKERPRLWTPEWVEEQQSFADDPKLLAFVHVSLFEILHEVRSMPTPAELRTLPGSKRFRQGLTHGWIAFRLRAEFVRIQGCQWTQEWDAGAHVRAHTRLDLAADATREAIDTLASTVESWNYRQERLADARMLRQYAQEDRERASNAKRLR